MYRIISEQTNSYALQLQVERNKADEHWTPVTPDEMCVYFGIHIFMSVVDLPEIKMYLAEDKLYGNFAIADIMTRDRFEKISQYLHANDRAGYIRQDTIDRIRKGTS